MIAKVCAKKPSKLYLERRKQWTFLMDVLVIHNGFISPELRSRLDADYPRPEWFHKLVSWNIALSGDPGLTEEEISGQPSHFDTIVLVGLLGYQQRILEEQGILNHFAKEGDRVVVYQALVTYRRSSYVLHVHQAA